MPNKREYPDIDIKKVNGTVKYTIDKNNIFSYTQNHYKQTVKSEFQKRFGGRPNDDETLKDLKRDVESFLMKCVRRGIIAREEDMDRLYKGGLMPGDPGYHSASYVKCF